MVLRLGMLGLVCGFLCGCANSPESYAPPAQRPFFPAPPGAARVLKMADADAQSYFVGDIGAELMANTWRWTGKRPTIRLRAAARELEYSIDFALAGSTLEQTGPVTLSYFVNDRLLDRVRYAKAGRQLLKKTIPAEWVNPGENVTIAAEIDKLWVPPQRSGARLGFILVAMGLEQIDPEKK